MNFLVGVRSARVFGGNTTYSLVGDYLQAGLDEYGEAIAAIEITACFRGGAVGHPSLQASYEAFHSSFLPSLPRTKFFRKKSRIDITYETQVADASFLEKHGFLAIEEFSAAMNEIADRLHLIDSKLRAADSFDVERFHRDVARMAREIPESLDELRALKAKLDAAEKQRLATMDPWERLDIDWDDYHPSARALLDDPFFWSSTDGYAPHGNDTGADLLADYRKWNIKHPNQPSYRMATALLAGWDIAQIDLHTTDQDGVSSLLDRDPISLVTTDEALIAVAFAALKLRGCCDPATRRLALNAIARERVVCKTSNPERNNLPKRLATLEIMVHHLEQAPEQPDA